MDVLLSMSYYALMPYANFDSVYKIAKGDPIVLLKFLSDMYEFVRIIFLIDSSNQH